MFFAAGAAHASQELLGAARLEIGNRGGLIDASAWSFLWVVDAPMFEETDGGGWTAVHHPFTAPLPEWADKFETEPGGAIADAYDMVLQRVRDRRRLDPYPPAARCSRPCST